MEFEKQSFMQKLGIETNVTEFIPETFYKCSVFATNMAGDSPTVSVNFTTSEFQQ